MSNVYLVRHGQAGTREHYDTLSPLGREQSRLLGEYFATQRILFSAAYTGGMERQKQTAQEASEAYRKAGVPFPELQEEALWREFDLDRVYRGIAPQLGAVDAEFRREFEDMMAQVRTSNGDAGAEVHRRWSSSDVKVVDAWIKARFPFDGESWNDFRARIAMALRPAALTGDIIVFTSATPAAIWAGAGLDILDDRVLRIAGVLYNASFTVLRTRGEQVRLFSMNNVPHLTDVRMRTHR